MFNKVNSALRRHKNNLCRQRWKNFCAKTDHSCPSSKLWEVTRALCGDRGPSRSLACMALALSMTRKETAHLFAMFYARVLPPTSLPAICNVSCVLDDPFSLLELREYLRRLRCCSASGPDKIPAQAFLNLLDSALLSLLKMYSDVWESGCVPPEWREAWVVPIHKPGQ